MIKLSNKYSIYTLLLSFTALIAGQIAQAETDGSDTTTYEPHTSANVIDCGVIEITSTKKLRRIVYLANGEKIRIGRLSGHSYTLEANDVTELWVRLRGQHGGSDWSANESTEETTAVTVSNSEEDNPPRRRGIWKHFTVDDSEQCGPVVGMCENPSDCADGQTCLIDGVCSASVGGRVFSDNDSNGLFDSADGFVNPAIVLLEQPGIDGGWQNVAAETTDDMGSYNFDQVAPNIDYRILFQNIVGEDPFVFTLQDIGDDDAIDSDVDGEGVSSMFTLAPNETTDNVWAGIVPATVRTCFDDPDCANTLTCGEGGVCATFIGGRIFIDVNRDGIFNAGDMPSNTVLVRLQADLNGVWTNTAAKLTDTSGFYQFTSVTPVFDYRITVEAFPGDPLLVFTTPNVGTDDTIDSDVDASGISGTVVDGYDLINPTVWAGLLQ